MIIASIDIGTNTVLLLIAEVQNNQNLKVIRDEYRIPRIGKNLLPGNNISNEKIVELLKVLSDYKAIINEHDCNKVILSATNAFRIAKNSNEICSLIEQRFNWKVKIVSGEDEAQLSYLGAITNRPEDKNYMVIDIGGGSTELIFGKGKSINFRKSFQTGVVSGTEKFFKNDPPTEIEIGEFRNFLDNTFDEIKQIRYAPKTAIALAGTPTTLACMKYKMEHFDESKIENSILEKIDIQSLIKELSLLGSDGILKKYKSVVQGREDLILSGAIILLNIMELNRIPQVIVSTKGIRYGAILNFLSK